MPGDPLVEFLAVMRQLRAECAWKQAQTHESLRRYLIEESWETIEAIDSGDPDHLREELGDLLLQVYFHAVIAEEVGDFTLDDVAAGIIDKMRRRNPHVFGDAVAGSAAEIDANWQRIKATEQQRSSVFDGLPPGLPALLLADKVLDRLSRSGVDPSSAGEEGIGERLLALVVEARSVGIDAEDALRVAVRKMAEGH